MNKLIFVENYVFGQEWFHSIGLKRIDTRTKESRAEALAEGVKVTPQEWPVTLQLYIRSPDDTLRVLNFQSRQGEEGTVDMFLDVLHQLREPRADGSRQQLPDGYKAFLMEDLQIQAQPGKENKDGQRERESGGVPEELTPAEGRDDSVGRGNGGGPGDGPGRGGGAGEGDSPRGSGQGNRPADGRDSGSSGAPPEQDSRPGTGGSPEGVSNQ